MLPNTTSIKHVLVGISQRFEHSDITGNFLFYDSIMKQSENMISVFHGFGIQMDRKC